MKVSERLRDLAAAQTKCKCGAHAMMHQRADQTEWQVTCSLCKVAARERKTSPNSPNCAMSRPMTTNVEVTGSRETGEREMIYEPNTTRWHVGDHVIHDCDAKKECMLMVVICASDDQCVTRYLHRETCAETYHNPTRALHDPARFGIEVPNVM